MNLVNITKSQATVRLIVIGSTTWSPYDDEKWNAAKRQMSEVTDKMFCDIYVKLKFTARFYCEHLMIQNP